MKKLVVLLIVLAVVGSTVAAFAATGATPADILSRLTGRTVEELYQERQAGKTFGEIAKDTGKLEAFKDEMLKTKKDFLDQQVKDGKITQERADAIYDRMVDNQENCDGTGRGAGAGFGMGHGRGRGGMGAGSFRGAGCGMGRGNR